MKEIIYNSYNLSMDNVNNIVKRAKALILNLNDDILLGFGNNNY